MFHVISRCILLSSLAALVCAPAVSFAQEQKSTITGHVTDPSHAVIQNARIVIIPGDKVANSNDQGDFTVSGLAPGTYTVIASREGFAESKKTVTVVAGQNASVEIAMQISSTNEQIMVTAETGANMEQAVSEEIASPNILQ